MLIWSLGTLAVLLWGGAFLWYMWPEVAKLWARMRGIGPWDGF